MILPERSLHRTVIALLAVGLLSLGVVVLAATRLANAAPAFNGTAYPDTPPAPDFTLTDHTGSAASLADYRGRAVLLFFGFTRCPDVCPLTLRKVDRVMEDAGIGAEDLSVLFVSVDPEYDTPERMAEYVGGINDAITGLSGDSATIAGILASYGAYAAPTTGHDGHLTLAHSTIMYGIDRAGRLRVLIHADEPAEIVESDLEALTSIRG